MIKILMINGSPVENSSCQLALEKLAELTKENIAPKADATITNIDLNQLKFIPCQSCGKAPTPDFCFYDDDLTPIYKQIVETDIFIIGSPIYFDGVSAQAKSFIDRCNCFRPADFKHEHPPYPFIKILGIDKRPGAMILTGGKDAWFEGGRRTIVGLFKWIEVENCATITYCSDDFNTIGTILSDNQLLSEIKETSQLLADRVTKASNET